MYCFFRILTGFVCCKKCVGDQEPMDSLELGIQVKNGNYNVGFQNNEDKLWNYQSKSSKLRTSPIKMHRFLSTPSRTPRISGLKSQILKATFSS